MNKMMTVILGAAIGGVIGYFMGYKKGCYNMALEYENEKLDEIMESEDRDATSPYDPQDEKPDLEDLVSKYRTEDEHPTEDEPEEPYVITYDEFSEIGTNYTELSYYDEDDILVDEEDKVIDIESSIGRDCLSKFGTGTDDEDMVYVKNPRTGIYYEVTRLFGSYYPDPMSYNIDE